MKYIAVKAKMVQKWRRKMKLARYENSKVYYRRLNSEVVDGKLNVTAYYYDYNDYNIGVKDYGTITVSSLRRMQRLSEDYVSWVSFYDDAIVVSLCNAKQVIYRE